MRSSSTPHGTSASIVPNPAAETARLASENESSNVRAYSGSVGTIIPCPKASRNVGR
jgi:hypothetical protein